MTEDQIHRSILSFLEIRLPQAVIWHTPNGGSRNKIEAAKLKGLGTRAGIPDLLVFLKGRLLAIEVKKEGGRLSPAQNAMLQRLSCEGATTAVCRSVEDAEETVTGWVEAKDVRS